MNIECDQETLAELEHAFKFNDAVLRHLIVAMREAVVAPSPMMREEKRAIGRTASAANAAIGVIAATAATAAIVRRATATAPSARRAKLRRRLRRPTPAPA